MRYILPRTLIFAVAVFGVFLSGQVSWSLRDEAVEKSRQDRVAERADAYLNEGKRELERGNLLRAIRLLSEAVRKGAGDEAYRLRGVAYGRRGALPEALADFSRCINANRSDPSAYVLRGDIHNARMDVGEALSDYDAAIKLDPLYMDAYRGRGTAYLALQRYDLSIRDLQVVLQDEPNDLETLTNLGLACKMAGLPNAARDFWKKALNLETDNKWRQAVQKMVNDLPEYSSLEKRVGDLQGYLSRMADLPPPEAPAGAKHQGSHLNRSRDRARDSGFRQSDQQAGLKAKVGSDSQAVTGLNSGARSRTTWKTGGSAMGMKWNAQLKMSGNRVSGVVRILNPSGNEETHYCYGSFENGLIKASDPSGFRFTGRVTDDSRLVGTLTANDGTTFSVEVPLEAEAR